MQRHSQRRHHRSYLNYLLTYSTDLAASHLTNPYWYLDTGDMQPCQPTVETRTVTTNRGFVTLWNKFSAGKVSSSTVEYIMT